MLFIEQKSVAYATSHTVTYGTSTSDISSKDHGKLRASEVTQLTWEISADHLYVKEEVDILLEKWKAGALVNVAWGLKNEDGSTGTPASGEITNWTPKTGYKAGKALITSLTENAPNGEKATYSVTFTGVGDFSIVSA